MSIPTATSGVKSHTSTVAAGCGNPRYPNQAETNVNGSTNT